MALTVTNSNTIRLLHTLNATTASQARTIEQLTTGKRINAGKDDPAGLIALSSLNAELASVATSLDNNQRTDSVLTVADKSLGEISGLLTEIEGLVTKSASTANISASEIAANQAQIDNALTAIDRIVSTTNFNGKKLLDGTFSVRTTGFTGNAYLKNLRVFSRSETTADTTVTVSRVTSAQVASASFGFVGGSARTSGTTQVAIQGTLGTATITLTSGLTQAQIVTSINAAKGQTGVSAIQNSTNIKLNSTAFGTDAFVSVEVLSGGTINSSYSTATSDANTANDVRNQSKQTGIDAKVTVNGQTAGTNGLNVFYNANGLSLEFSLEENFGKGNTGATTSTSFTVNPTGGATFQLGTTTDTRSTIGVDSVASYNLAGGNGTRRLSELKSGGGAELKTDVSAARLAVRDAITEVASIRGRLGAFQKYEVGTAISSLQAAQNGLTQAASVIGDTDFAVATADLNRQQVLLQSNISLLGIANQQAAQILQLLQ
ncbi:MAG: flagellin [Planctomycetota bacterium]